MTPLNKLLFKVWMIYLLGTVGLFSISLGLYAFYGDSDLQFFIGVGAFICWSLMCLLKILLLSRVYSKSLVSKIEGEPK